MNSGVQFRSWSREIASTMVPMLYQREDLSRCGGGGGVRGWFEGGGGEGVSDDREV